MSNCLCDRIFQDSTLFEVRPGHAIMDPASCRVIYIDDRFPAEKWLTRDTMSSSTTNNRVRHALSLDLAELPLDLQANVNAILGVFNQGENSIGRSRRRRLTCIFSVRVQLGKVIFCEASRDTRSCHAGLHANTRSLRCRLRLQA